MRMTWQLSDCESEDAEVESDYPLAVKMMFNCDAESTAYSILRSMQNEAVPAKMASCMTQMEIWENGSHVRKKKKKPHPNIVDMFGVFIDDVPQMPDSLQEYPDALPQRLNPDGSGRNKTMFIVMKRYQWTLREYLSENDVSVRESTVILTQLVEAIVHLTLEGVAGGSRRYQSMTCRWKNFRIQTSVLRDMDYVIDQNDWIKSSNSVGIDGELNISPPYVNRTRVMQNKGAIL